MLGFQDVPPFPPLTGLPAPESGFSWQHVAWAIMILVSGCSALFAAWVKLSEKRLDLDREAEAKKLSLEVESLKLYFEQRKHFTDQIIAECERARLDESKAREEIYKSLAIINERDKTIREQHDMILELKSKVAKMEVQIANLQKKIG